MVERVEHVREQLRQVAVDLEGISVRLQGLVSQLPPTPAETSLEDMEDDPDVVTEVRNVISCVLNDFLHPATRDLAEAAVYEPGTRPPEPA